MSMGTFYALCGRTSSRNSIICSKHTFCGCEIRSDVASPHSWIPCVARITKTPCFLVMFVSVRVPRVPSKSPLMCFLTVWSSLFHVMSVVLNRHKPWLSKPHTYWPLGIWNEYNFSSLWFRDFHQAFRCHYSWLLLPVFIRPLIQRWNYSFSIYSQLREETFFGSRGFTVVVSCYFLYLVWKEIAFSL